MFEREVAYIGRDDPIEWRLSDADGDPLPPSFYATITRVTLVVGNTTLDTTDPQLPPDWCDWSAGLLRMTLGGTGLAPGRHRVRLIVYTSSHPDGLEDWRDIPWIVVRKTGTQTGA